MDGAAEGATEKGAAEGAEEGAAVPPIGEVPACAAINTLSTWGFIHLPGSWVPAVMMPPPTSTRRTAFRRSACSVLFGFFLLSESLSDIVVPANCRKNGITLINGNSSAPL